MRLHHTKHHNAYVTNLNASLEKLDAAMAKGDVSAIIALQGALRFNGGGHLNHTLFWENLTPPGSSSTSGPTGALKQAIEDCFCTVENLQKQFIPITIGVQGSGWGWLGYNKTTHRLEIATCANQDPLQATTGLLPIFGIDVWEVRNTRFLLSIFEVYSLIFFSLFLLLHKHFEFRIFSFVIRALACLLRGLQKRTSRLCQFCLEYY
jgi:superoxide dismutase